MKPGRTSRRFLVVALLAAAACSGRPSSAPNGAGTERAGGWIVYQHKTTADEAWSLYRARPDGSGREAIAPNLGTVLRYEPSPDRSEIAVWGDNRIWVIGAKGSSVRKIVEETRPNHAVGSVVWARDGKTIAYLDTTFSQGDAHTMAEAIESRVLAVPVTGGTPAVLAKPFRDPLWVQLGGYDPAAKQLLAFTSFSVTAGDPFLVDTANGTIAKRFEGIKIAGLHLFAVKGDLSKVFYSPVDKPNLLVERNLAVGTTRVLYEAAAGATVEKPLLSPAEDAVVFTVRDPAKVFVVKRSLRDDAVRTMLEGAGHKNASVDGVSSDGAFVWTSVDCTCGAGGAYYPDGAVDILDLETGKPAPFFRAAPGDQNALVAESIGYAGWFAD